MCGSEAWFSVKSEVKSQGLCVRYVILLMVKEVISFLENIKLFDLFAGGNYGLQFIKFHVCLSCILFDHLIRHLPWLFCTHSLFFQTQATYLANGANLFLSALFLETGNWGSPLRLRDCMRSLLFWDVTRHVGSYVPMFWHNLLIPSSRVKIGLISCFETSMTTHLWHVASLKSKHLIYTAVKAWNHTKRLYFKMMLKEGQCKTVRCRSAVCCVLAVVCRI
jgi:hypothetical protein